MVSLRKYFSPKLKYFFFIDKKVFAIILLQLFFSIETRVHSQNKKVLCGADILVGENLNLIKGKNLGIVTNHSAILSNGIHLVDTLSQIPEIKIKALFGPEHGIRGIGVAGEKIQDSVDAKTNIPVYSLYGKINKPTKEMLKNIDVLIFDIQDVGARFFTFISTLYYSIQASIENKIPILILDRPNPISGSKIDGPILDEELKSFVGIAPIPIQHGMTIGELAKYFVGEILDSSKLKADLKVVEMRNWKRKFYFDDCKLKWLKPSPNIFNISTALVYPGTCLFEGANVSEGRGTENPFQIIGAPFINSKLVISEMKKLKYDGAELEAVSFTPKEILNVVKNPKYKEIKCNGIKINVTNRNKFEPIKFTLKLIYVLKKLYPDSFQLKEKSFNRLVGDKRIYSMITEGKQPDSIINYYQKKLKDFTEIRKKYLIYN